MAFCKNCGNQIGDGDVACRFCGTYTGVTPVQGSNPNLYQFVPAVAVPKEKSVLGIVLAIVLPIVAVIVLIITLIALALRSSISNYLDKAKNAASSVTNHNSSVSAVYDDN